MRRWWSAWGWCAALVAALTMLGAPALAQDDGGGRRGFGRGRGGPMGGLFGERIAPEYLRRDLPRFVSDLELDDAQTTIVEALLLEYEAAFSEGAQSVRDAMNEVRETSPERELAQQELRDRFREMRSEIRALREATPEGEVIEAEKMAGFRERMGALREEAMALRPSPEEIQEMRDVIRPVTERWTVDAEALATAFVGDTKALLNDQQLELWPPFERALRRDKALPRGQLSGERVSLFRVVADLRLDPDDAAMLDPVLDAYAIDLDEALARRDEQLAMGRDERADAMTAQDFERATALMERDAQYRIGVRRVNETYAESIAATLTETLGETEGALFRRAWLEAAYPRIYRARPVERAFETARGIEGLGEDTIDAIGALEAGFAAELATRNERLVQVTRDEEPARSQRWMRRRAGFTGEGGRSSAGAEDPIGAQFDARAEMEQSYRERLEALLTPEQVALLPEAPSNEDGRRGRFGRRGGGGDREAARARMLERFDTNRDGELSDEERAAMRDADGA